MLKIKEKYLKISENNKDSLKVLVYNKIDLKYKKQYFKNFKFDVVLETSYINKESIENLKYAIFKLKELEWLNKTDEILVLNTRQKELIKKSIENLKEFEKVLKNCSFLDVALNFLEAATENLLELLGKRTSEAIIEEIFSKFCVGK